MKEREYLNAVSKLPCVACGAFGVHIHHATGLKYRAKGKKAPYWQVIPLCPTHHQHGGHGVAIHAGVKTWEQKYGSQDEHIKNTQEKVGWCGL